MDCFEQIGIPYELHSDGCYYPKLAMSEQEPPHYGRYGLLHKQYLQEHRPLAYDILLACGELVVRLNQVDDIAQARHEVLVKQMKEKQGIRRTQSTGSNGLGRWHEQYPFLCG